MSFQLMRCLFTQSSVWGVLWNAVIMRYATWKRFPVSLIYLPMISLRTTGNRSRRSIVFVANSGRHLVHYPKN